MKKDKTIDFKARSTFLAERPNIVKYKKQIVERLNKRVYNHITVTSNFPEWKQINFLEEMILGTSSLEHQLVNEWKTNLVKEKNILKAQILESNSFETIDELFSQFNLLSIPVEI